MNTKTTDFKHVIAGLFFTCIISTLSYAQNVGINGTGNAPDASAMLDIDANNKGLLIPRVALTGTTDAVTISSPATSLLVYNTATAGGVTPGYYYNSGTSVSPIWTPFSSPSKFTVSFFGRPMGLIGSTNLTVAGGQFLTGGGTQFSPSTTSSQYASGAVTTITSNCTFNGMRGWISAGTGNVVFSVYYYRQTDNAPPVTPTLIGSTTVNISNSANLYQVNIPTPVVPINLLPGDMILIFASKSSTTNSNFCGSIEFINN